MSGSYLELKTLTWPRDTHGLFDYEASSLIKNTFKIRGPESLYRHENQCYLISEDVKSNSDPVLKIDQKKGEFTASLIPEDPNNAMWLVVKNIRSRRGNALRLREGDWIKLGRVQFKVQKISISTQSTVIGVAPQYFLQSVSDDLDVKEDLVDEAGKENATCRICLSETETQIDPFISPCKCSGTMKYIHADCLKEWIKSKVSSRVTDKGMTVYIKDLCCELCGCQLPTFVNYKEKNISLINITFPAKSFIVLEEYRPDNFQVNGLHIISLDENQAGVIGRGHESDIKISDISVSRHHCQIKLLGSDFYLEDTKSKFGTLGKLNSQVLLRSNTELTVQINRTVLSFKYKHPWTFKRLCCCPSSGQVSNEPTSYFTQPDVQQSFQEPLSNRVTMNGGIRPVNPELSELN